VSVKSINSLKIQQYLMGGSYSPNSASKENVNIYVCEECGEKFQSLNEYIAHYKHLHPRSIGTAIT
jgi:hypothetical protein